VEGNRSILGSAGEIAGSRRTGSRRIARGVQCQTIGHSFSFDRGSGEWIGRINKLDARGQDVYLGILAPQNELLVDAAHIRNESMLINLLIVLVTIPVAWLLSRAISKPLRQLSAEGKAIQQFNFEQTAPVDSFIQEIHDLAQTMDVMRWKFLDISNALAAEKNLDRLLERVLEESLVLTGADGSVIYLIEDDELTLLPAHRIWRDASLLKGRPALAPLHVNHDAAHAIVAAFVTNQSRVAVLHRGDTDSTARYFSDSFDGLGTDRIGIAAVPLHNRNQDVIGASAANPWRQKRSSAWT
jgi:hypothetical protein